MRFFHKINTLFFRLLFSFFAALLIPVLVLILYYGVIENSLIEQALVSRGKIICSHSANLVRDIIEKYRHRAYSLSTNQLVISILESDIPVEQVTDSRALYELLFTVMKGDIDFASAQIVSMSGQVRHSTGLFPRSYDLRYNRNEWNPFFDLSRAHKDTASLITLSNRYTNNNNRLIVMNILRRIQNSEGKNLGYVAVDVFQTTFFRVNSELFFEDLILIDSANFLASSLLHTDRYGSFDKFDSLKNASFSSFATTSATENYLRIMVPVKDTGMVIAGIIDKKSYLKNARSTYFITPYIIAAAFLLAGFSAFFLSRSIARPVNDLISTMRRVDVGLCELRADAEKSQIHEVYLLNSAFNNMISQLDHQLAAERKTLEAQLNPHFLYNTLNTVKSIAALHGEKDIVTIITRLGRLLRSGINNTGAEATVKESLDLVRDYLTIQKIRFGEKLYTDINADDNLLDALIPKFIIQPLVENALIHGLEPKTGDWCVSVSVRTIGERMRIEVLDNGIGIPPGTLPDNFALLKNSGHVGLYNIFRRLQLRHASSFKFTVTATEGGTQAVIVLPIISPARKLTDGEQT